MFVFAMVTTVQWSRAMSRWATNGERRILLLCGLEGCDWRRSFLLDVEVKPPFFVRLIGYGRQGGDVISVMDSGDCAVKSRNSSSVEYQKSVLAFAGLRHAMV